MRLLVEISQGAGNCVQGTPLVHALWLMGHDVDLFINSNLATKLKPLWEGWDKLGRVFTSPREFNVRDYDFGVSAYGRRQLTRLFAPGMCLKIENRHVQRQNESNANTELARWLGYNGPTPPQFVQPSDRKFDLPERFITIHAGCDPATLKYKNWPHWHDFARRLKEAGWTVVAVGTDSDRSADNWERDFHADVSFNLSFTDLCALMSRATFHFGNDSGYGHIAAALNLPGMVLFGPTDPVKNRPHSPVMRIAVADIHEGEERDLHAERPVPISRLTLDEVWAKAEQVLKDPARAEWPTLPERVTDSVEQRWEHYVAMTRAQPEPESIEETGHAPEAPKVSVVIPTYNRADNVERAVKSALAQEGTPLEVIVVDDGSTDDTPARFANPPQGVRYIRKPNGGASSARNAGLRRAQGEWIALLDSDDEWTPDKLKVQLDAMGAEYVAAASRHVHVNADGSRETKPEVLPGRDNHLFRDLYENLSLKTSSLVFRRHLLAKVGYFNEHFPISNDWDFFLRLARAVNNSGLRICEQALLTAHRSTDSISKTGRANALEEAYSRICMVNALLHTDDPGTIKRHVNRAARKHLELSRAYRKAGEKGKAKLHAKEAVRAGLYLKGAWRWLQA